MRRPRVAGDFPAGTSASAEDYATTKEWDYLDKRPVVVNKARVPRTRPAMAAGCRLHYKVICTDPELIPLAGTLPALNMRALVEAASYRQGLGDFRPKFGLFKIVQSEVEPYSCEV